MTTQGNESNKRLRELVDRYAEELHLNSIATQQRIEHEWLVLKHHKERQRAMMSQKGNIMSLTKQQQRNLIVSILIAVIALYISVSIAGWSQHRQDIAAQIATRQAVTEATIEAR